MGAVTLATKNWKYLNMTPITIAFCIITEYRDCIGDSDQAATKLRQNLQYNLIGNTIADL
jgi:hypothetical protein